MNVVNNSRDVIYSSGIVFGTSGARGLVKDFTPQVCAAEWYQPQLWPFSLCLTICLR